MRRGQPDGHNMDRLFARPALDCQGIKQVDLDRQGQGAANKLLPIKRDSVNT